MTLDLTQGSVHGILNTITYIYKRFHVTSLFKLAEDLKRFNVQFNITFILEKYLNLSMVIVDLITLVNVNKGF